MLSDDQKAAQGWGMTKQSYWVSEHGHSGYAGVMLAFSGSKQCFVSLCPSTEGSLLTTVTRGLDEWSGKDGGCSEDGRASGWALAGMFPPGSDTVLTGPEAKPHTVTANLRRVKRIKPEVLVNSKVYQLPLKPTCQVLWHLALNPGVLYH